MQQQAIIIGSGIGGLATAALLGKAGYKVTVYEKNEQPGGRASVFSENGFTFDMGPSWYLMPDVFQHFFELLGKRVEDYLDLTRLTPSYRIYFKDSTEMVDITGDLTQDLKTFESLEPGAAATLTKYLKSSAEQYEIAKQEFMYKNYDSVRDFFTWRTITQGTKLSIFRTMEQYVSRYFRDDRVKKILQYQLVFLGNSPYNTPALYNIMNHIDFNMGVFYPKGGIYKITEALVALAEEFGATIRCNSPVEKIVVHEGKAAGIVVDGRILHADLVISNADIHFTETQLLDAAYRTFDEAYWQSRTLAPSAVILYLGVKGRIKSLEHHTLIFSQDWQKNFAQIFDAPTWPDDPSFYVCAPSKTDPTVAPKDHENLFVLVPVASGLDYTDAELTAYGDKIIETLATTTGIPDLAERIVYRKQFSVKDFMSRYNSYQGTGLGLAHTLRQTAIFRPNNVSRKVKNFYYVGANTNPGIGMPICLISAELAWKRIAGIRSAEPLTSVVPPPS